MNGLMNSSNELANQARKMNSVFQIGMLMKADWMKCECIIIRLM